MSDVLALILVVVLLLVAAGLALAETAIARVNRVKALHLDQERSTKASAALLKIVEDPAPYMNVVLLLTLVCHVTGTALATSVALHRFGDGGEAISAAVMTFVIFVFAEVIPKTYSVQRTDRAALGMSRPVLLLGRALRPLGNLLIGFSNLALLILPGKGMPKGPFVTEDEIRHMVDVAED
jgi:Mg2+/Co2+ transporter CorB